MARLRAVAILRHILATVPTALGLVALAACVVLTPVSAYAQSKDAPYGETDKPCYRAIRKSDEQLVLAFNPECDLRRLAHAFPIAEDGKNISSQRYLQSLYAMNGRDRTDGLRPTVGRGCVKPGKPSSDATPGELAACPDGLMNYYATPTDDSVATIIVPYARQLTFEEKLTKRVKELETENAKLKSGKSDDKPATGTTPEAERKIAELEKTATELRAQNATLQTALYSRSWLYGTLVASLALAIWYVIAIYLWCRDEKKRPIKYVNRDREVVKEIPMEGDWSEREQKLTDSYRGIMAERIQSKDAEIAALKLERDQAVAAAKKAQAELAAKPMVDPTIIRINEERGRAIEDLGRKLAASGTKIAELEALLASPKPQPENVDVQKLAEDKDAAQAEAARLGREKKADEEEIARLHAMAEKLVSGNRDFSAQLNETKAKLDKATGESERAKDEVQRLTADLATVTDERDNARNGNNDLREQLETFRGDATKAKDEADALRREVELLSAPDVVAKLTSELAERDERIRNFQACMNSMPPPPAETVSTATTPGQPMAPAGAVAGSAISPVTSEDRKTTLPGMPAVTGVSPVTSDGSEASSALDRSGGPEVSVAEESGAEVDETMVLEVLRDHLVAVSTAKAQCDGLKSRIANIRTIVTVTEGAIEEAGNQAAKEHGQERLGRARGQIAKLQEELVESDKVLQDLQQLGEASGYDPFRLKAEPDATDVPSQQALAAGMARAIEDCRDIITPPTYRWPVPQLDPGLQQERDVLYAAVNDVSIMLGEDPASIKGKPAVEIANRLKTRAVTITATASHSSQSFTSAHERVEQLEGVLAEERKTTALVQEKLGQATRDLDELRERKAGLRRALFMAQKQVRELQALFDRAVEERRVAHEAQTGRTAEERLALGELRVAEAEHRIAILQTQLEEARAESQLLRENLDDIGKVHAQDPEMSGLPVGQILTKDQWDSRKRRILNGLAALWSEEEPPADLTAAEASAAARNPPKSSSKNDARSMVQQRLAKAEWGEVQSLFKTLIGEVSVRQQRGDRLVYLVGKDEELRNLHDFLYIPLEYAHGIDPTIVVRVAEGQCVHHASDPLCGRRPTEDSVSGVRSLAQTMRPLPAVSRTPEELQDLLGNGGRSSS